MLTKAESSSISSRLLSHLLDQFLVVGVLLADESGKFLDLFALLSHLLDQFLFVGVLFADQSGKLLDLFALLSHLLDQFLFVGVLFADVGGEILYLRLPESHLLIGLIGRRDLPLDRARHNRNQLRRKTLPLIRTPQEFAGQLRVCSGFRSQRFGRSSQRHGNLRLSAMRLSHQANEPSRFNFVHWKIEFAHPDPVHERRNLRVIAQSHHWNASLCRDDNRVETHPNQEVAAGDYVPCFSRSQVFFNHGYVGP